MALGELKKNESTLGKQLKKVSSGLKINGAGDGASEYAISKRMTVQVRSLGQDQQNVQNGKALVNVALGGLDATKRPLPAKADRPERKRIDKSHHRHPALRQELSSV